MIPVTQNINKAWYIRLLRRHLFPVLHQMNSFGMQRENILFQQDNAPVHKPYSVVDWFEKNSSELVEYPTYFPDLDLMKHIWIELGKWLTSRGRYRASETSKIAGPRSRSLPRPPHLSGAGCVFLGSPPRALDLAHSRAGLSLNKTVPNRALS